LSGARAVSEVRSHKKKVDAALQPARVAPSRVEEPPPPAAVARPSSSSFGNVRPAREAWELLAAPLRERKGIRLTIYGITGKGKTTGLKDFLRYVEVEQLVDLTIIHDVKFRELQQYDGPVIHEGRDLYTPEHAPTRYPATAVLRKRGLDHMPSVDAAARVALESADQGLRTMLVVDEFARALEEDIPGGFRKGSTNRIACEGFGLGASLVAVKQLPQFMPSEVRAQSELLLFGLGGDGLTHLVDERVVDPKMATLVGRLERGHFVIKPSEGAWSEHVYKVPPP
jgi:hypothetical protein